MKVLASEVTPMQACTGGSTCNDVTHGLSKPRAPEFLALHVDSDNRSVVFYYVPPHLGNTDRHDRSGSRT